MEADKLKTCGLNKCKRAEQSKKQNRTKKKKQVEGARRVIEQEQKETDETVKDSIGWERRRAEERAGRIDSRALSLSLCDTV